MKVTPGQSAITNCTMQPHEDNIGSATTPFLEVV